MFKKLKKLNLCPFCGKLNFGTYNGKFIKCGKCGRKHVKG